MKQTTLTIEKPWYASEFAHIRVPKKLLHGPEYSRLSLEALVLYSALLDRTGLSAQNSESFTTPEGRLFVYFTLKAISELLRCGHDKATYVMRELVSAGLVETRRSGVGRPYQIILIPFNWQTGHPLFDEYADWFD